MRNKNELQDGLAVLLQKLRERAGLSKSKMAALAGVDDHTWANYESGLSAPSVPVFLALYDELGLDAMRDMLAYLYPSVYGSAELPALRAAVSHYFMAVASPQAVREWNYLIRGGHGSNIGPQLQMFTMIDHLPLECRVLVAELVDSLWKLCEARDDLVGLDEVMPDVELFRDGLAKGREAAYDRRGAYTVLTGERK